MRQQMRLILSRRVNSSRMRLAMISQCPPKKKQPSSIDLLSYPPAVVRSTIGYIYMHKLLNEVLCAKEVLALFHHPRYRDNLEVTDTVALEGEVLIAGHEV